MVESRSDIGRNDFNDADEALLQAIVKKLAPAWEPFRATIRDLRKKGQNERADKLLSALILAQAAGLGSVQSIEITFEDGTGCTVTNVGKGAGHG